VTIVVAVACPEGLVLAADSRATSWVGGSARVATDHAQKLFSVSDRFGVATFGWAHLEGNTIAGLMEEFEAQTKPAGHVDEALERLKDYFGDRLKRHLDKKLDEPPPEGVDVIGFVVGGYDENGVGRLKNIYLPSGTVVPGASTGAGQCGANWEGEAEVLTRLLKGWDPSSIDVSAWPTEQVDALGKAEYVTLFSQMALQDAVDFAAFAVRTTIDMHRFSDGTVGTPGRFPTCGGNAELLVITSRGIEWLKESKLQTTLARSEVLGS
jgi:20S proteasome alpha/beta subunit